MSIDPSKPNSFLQVALWMVAAVMIPFAITLSTVHDPSQPPNYAANPTPYGYTWSLSIFWVPILIFHAWFNRYPEFRVERKAYWLVVAAIFLLGTVLDVGFGYHFFYFPNTGAVAGLYIPAFDWGGFHWVSSYLPIEEFGFYLLGGIFIATLYLWGVVYWFRRYSHDDHAAVCRGLPKLGGFHGRLLAAGTALIVLAVVAKKLGPYPAGFPGYFTFIVLLGLLPGVFLMRTLQYLINWRALMFTVFVLLAMSIVYEASLGVPYGWWKYHNEQMIGILIGAWSYLPIEAVIIWLIIGFVAVLLFEGLRAYFYMERSAKEALLGTREGNG
ncbi:hypothetical protein [Endothiovibrio diazotrophicus]